MDTVIKIGRELIGLFVDDGSLALAVVGLLGAIALLMHAGLIDVGLAAFLLVAGSIAALVENVVRSIRQK
ncbi:MAG: hypothetical protein JWN94_553 [Betaproteobacteria bacterium]|jgi:hypothetical protein|nr:hypothetical protein [Betaproteobacteria bacterium]